MANYEIAPYSMPMPQMIPMLSSIIQREVQLNDLCWSQREEFSVFHGVPAVTIPIQSYLERIYKYANCSPSCFIVAYIYLQRFTKFHPATIPINSYTIHRLLLASVRVAVKFMDDRSFENTYYARVGGITMEEMNLLEVKFLFGLSFELNVTPQAFHETCSCIHVETMMAYKPPLNVVLPSANTKVKIGKLIHRSSHDQDEANHRRQQRQHQDLVRQTLLCAF